MKEGINICACRASSFSFLANFQPSSFIVYFRRETLNGFVKVFTILMLGVPCIFGGGVEMHAHAASQPLTSQQESANCPGQVEVFYYDGGNGIITCVSSGQSGYFQNIDQIVNQSSVTANFTAAVSPPPPPIAIPPGQSMSFQAEMTSGRSVNGAVTVP